MFFAPEKEEKYQKNDEGTGFEESDSEQALVLQHDAPPPGLDVPSLRCSSCPKSSADGEKLWMDDSFDANMLFPNRASGRTARCAVSYNERLELTG